MIYSKVMHFLIVSAYNPAPLALPYKTFQNIALTYFLNISLNNYTSVLSGGWLPSYTCQTIFSTLSFKCYANTIQYIMQQNLGQKDIKRRYMVCIEYMEKISYTYKLWTELIFLTHSFLLSSFQKYEIINIYLKISHYWFP